MQMLIRYVDGSLGAALLLSAGIDSLRLAIPGRDDAAELRLHQGKWLWEDSSAVEIEAIGAIV